MKEVELQILVNGVYRVVDIDKSTVFNFNLQIKDATDPTVTVNTFSTQISIPKTQNNDDLFSQIWKIDSVIFNFNPIKRTDFRLYINYNLFESGYIKLESITKTNYNIRLFGGLGDYFYALSETKLKDLDFGDYLTHIVNEENVKNAISGTGLIYNINGQNITGQIGYALTYQGQYDNFDSDQQQNVDDAVEEVTWHDPIGNKTYTTPQLTEHGRIFRNENPPSPGTFPIIYSEYRDYYQKPLIKLTTIYNKILDYMLSQGWRTNLDPTFFSNSPYFNDTWIVLPNYDVSNSTVSGTLGIPESDLVSNVYKQEDNLFETFEFDIDIPNNGGIDPSKDALITVSIPIAIIADASNLTVSDSDIQYLFKVRPLEIKGGVIVNPPGSNQIYEELKDENGSTTTILNQANVLLMYPPRFEDAVGRDSFYYKKVTGENSSDSTKAGKTADSIFYFTATVLIPGGTFTFLNRLNIFFTLSGSTYFLSQGFTTVACDYGVQLEIQEDYNISFFGVEEGTTRDNSQVGYSDMIRSEYTLLDFMLSFNKIFDLYYIKDSARKVVDIVTRSTFYGEKQKLDWTHKIDYSKDFILTPVPFEYRYGVLKWNDLDTKYEKEYLNKYSREYGSFRIDNGYEFSDAEYNLLENNIFNNCIIASDYSPYYLGKSSTIYKDDKELPHFQDKDGTTGIDIDMVLVFRERIGSSCKPYIVTGDTTTMLQNGYMWINKSSEYPASGYYKYARTVQYGNEVYSLNFGRPAVAYNDTEAALINSGEVENETIYYRFWQRYLSDFFNQECKKLTCYVVLTNSDIQENLFRKFIYINDTIWVVNKIYQFNPLNHEPTKVDLIKVQDINNYTNEIPIGIEFDIYYPNDSEIPLDENNSVIETNSTAQTITIKVDSTVNWQITDYDGVTIDPLSGSAGETLVNITIPANDSGQKNNFSITFQYGTQTRVLSILQNYGVLITAQGVNTIVALNGSGFDEFVSIIVPDGSIVNAQSQSNIGYYFYYWTINGESTNYNASFSFTAIAPTDLVAIYSNQPNTLGWANPQIDSDLSATTVTNRLNIYPGMSFQNVRALSGAAAVTISPTDGNASTDISFTLTASTATRFIEIRAELYDIYGNFVRNEDFIITQQSPYGTLNLTFIPQNQFNAQSVDMRLTDSDTGLTYRNFTVNLLGNGQTTYLSIDNIDVGNYTLRAVSAPPNLTPTTATVIIESPSSIENVTFYVTGENINP